jgi:hypothetical protein
VIARTRRRQETPYGGDGRRFAIRAQGKQNRKATGHRTGRNRRDGGQSLIGTAYIHTVLDDCSRLAYFEIRDDETKETAVSALRNGAARGARTRPAQTANRSPRTS